MKILEKLKQCWGPYVHRAATTLLLDQQRLWAEERKSWQIELEKEKDRAAEAIRRVCRIEYAREQEEIAIRVVVPPIELSACYQDGSPFFQHAARYVGHMLEREFAQLNATTLAQALRSSEERQRKIDAERYKGVWSNEH